ncbi:MAG: homoserine dehydrogenase [Deltaproteobacteria bacterium]|nr:homoserine dehydrogenase [Deltaproteobacteria bacterium]MBW2415891.1 homoserine dehydrogenase [Deltaproteobacteria bacterium]
MGVGLVGLGTIGVGVVRAFQQNGPLIDERLGAPLVLRRIADIDLDTDRHVPLDAYQLGRDWKELVEDPSIDVVIELIGGTGVALEVVRGALAAGKRVVTANKALLAHHGPELYAVAREHGGEIAFEASVGGTIPVLRALREGLCADRVSSLHGVVNGTCNYILTEMEARGEPYAACLKRAQDLGLAEADPSFDVNGMDSTHKLAILVGLGMGLSLHPDDIPTEGIEDISPVDIEYAEQFGLRIKLLAIAKQNGERLDARVHPTMIPASSVLARVDGPMNAIQVQGEFSGPTLYYGAGAGSLPTASAVVADVMELARSLRAGAAGRVPPLGVETLHEARPETPGECRGEYYLRFTALDRPGVLATITGALARHGISISSVVQPERHESRAVPVVIMTHSAPERELREALEEAARLEDITAAPRVIRVERDL